jgi:hypothetical protein
MLGASAGRIGRLVLIDEELRSRRSVDSIVVSQFFFNFFSLIKIKILFHFSSDIEITVDFLTEVDKLIQLLESPIFTCKC